MKRITALRLRDTRRQRFELEVNGEPRAEVAAEVIVSHQLKKGQAVSEELIESICKEDEFVRARNLAARYIALRPRSTGEVQRYLRNKDFSRETVQRVIDRAVAMGDIDNRNFAALFIKNRKKLKPTGPRKLAAELREKGIPQAVIEDVVQQELTLDEQRKLARFVVAKKCKTLGHSDQPKQRARLVQHLLRQGFDPDIVELTINELIGELPGKD
jgi:regulatory protein